MTILGVKSTCSLQYVANVATTSFQFQVDNALCSRTLGVYGKLNLEISRANHPRHDFRVGRKPQVSRPASHASTCFDSRILQLGRSGNVGRVCCVMESMEISEEEILGEEQRILEEEQEGELYLGKEESFEVADTIDENSETVPPEIRECWDLWQRVGLPISKIAKQRNMTETGVFFCIFSCIQNDFYVDWYELCKEAQFTLDISKRLIQATEKLVAEAKGAPIEWPPLMKLCSSGVTEVHFGLYMTMLRCGFSYETILNIASQREYGQPVTDWGTPSSDDERFPTQISEAAMLQWLLEKDGASLLEIALKYRECDEVELMRLLLHLEKVGKIFRRQGIFRAL
ncbi:hypothetical protein MPTK1_6g06200 [Marchantia polymorpha subsp. ruderalis]|uniref:Uncharacterized protein n=2 Tax=Marchantia polymorpha TaxID=3197 RepID=A0A176VQX4_MARPO|nr:hypothetical protein AXG93_2675s1350 [Marchantia polymorpha subsp. ruderalis]PTQ32538.1 hypothetical protein MARPO_0097s0024 [Marchantia polymorpha]BBN13776.1 hypothetical protein Mp_6g06200 [Marchantia polymorpha subsp. ruderalis]|eukprot:PTQ32538.1 hypothetical protein MARPO_0097s0024 [Marchantia polymorpha]